MNALKARLPAARTMSVKDFVKAVHESAEAVFGRDSPIAIEVEEEMHALANSQRTSLPPATSALSPTAAGHGGGAGATTYPVIQVDQVRLALQAFGM
jgi:hypothetical protein